VKNRHSASGKIDVSAAPSAPLASPFEVLPLVLDTSVLPPGPEDLPAPEPPPRDGPKGRVVIRREVAGRSGHPVVVVTAFPDSYSEQEIDETARLLRKACGCGGTVHDREIEMQGQRVPPFRKALEKMGWRVDGER